MSAHTELLARRLEFDRLITACITDGEEVRACRAELADQRDPELPDLPAMTEEEMELAWEQALDGLSADDAVAEALRGLIA